MARTATHNDFALSSRPFPTSSFSHSSSSTDDQSHQPPTLVPSSKRAPAPTTTKSTANVASHKPEIQCLGLCRRLTLLGDQVSIPVLEYLTSSKSLEIGFEGLAQDFLECCRILLTIESGLEECTHIEKSFPHTMIEELNHKFRLAQAEFRTLEHLSGKLLSTTKPKKWGWGKMFGETDVKKMATTIARTRESLNQSVMVFQYSLGCEQSQKELGIGLTGLQAALSKSGRQAFGTYGRSKTLEGGLDPYHHQPQHPHHPQANEYNDNHQVLSQQPAYRQLELKQQQQLPHVPPPLTTSWSSNPSSPHNEVPHYNGLDGDMRAVSDLNRYATATNRHHPMPHSTEHFDGYQSTLNHHTDRNSILDTESSSLLGELSAMDMIDSTKVIRHEVDTSTVPRATPKTSLGPEAANLKAALVSAIRSRNHKLLEQLLDRSVSANTGPNMHALNEAILAHDTDSARVLLLYGADPNDADRHGVTPLIAAVEESFVSGATLLLKYGADPNLAAGRDLESPLAMAVKANRVAISHLLLTYNGDVNHITANGETLLISAINKKVPEKFIDLLLNYGANPNAKSREGKTALFDAIQLGRTDIVTRLLEHGADPNLPGPKHMLWPSTYQTPCLQLLLSHGADHKKTPGIMELAASVNNIESVRLLLKAGVNPNTKKDGTYTPLCTAIRDDRPELLELLLASGADPNVPASEYPTFKCVTHNRVHFLPKLVAAGADLHSPKGILEMAVNCKNTEALNWLLDQGLNPNDKNPKGMSPLTTAIRENHIDLVDLLLQRGADPNMRGQDWPICMAVKNPPILSRLLSVLTQPKAFKGVMEMAVSANQLESVKLLLAAGVSVEDKNCGVFSPLTTAIRENRREIITYLINDGGADVNSPGEHLPIVKALRRFRGQGDTEILEMLLEHGADPNKMHRGWNAVMQAVENGEADVLRLVCSKAGVDLSFTDDNGRNVLDMAKVRAWDEAVEIIEDGTLQFLNAAGRR